MKKIQKGAAILAAQMQQCRRFETLPEKLVRMYALLYTLATTPNEFSVTTLDGDTDLSMRCADYVKSVTGCSDDEFDDFMLFMQEEQWIVVTHGNRFETHDHLYFEVCPQADNIR